MWLYICAITAIIGALLYKLLFSKPINFWEKYGIREIDTSPAVSNLDLALSRKLFSAKDDYAYAQMRPDEKFCGLTEMGKPLLLVKDMELIKRVLIKDFDHFVDRRQFFADEDDILRKQLPSLTGNEWKGVRSAMTPTFTTGKIRKMMECFNSVAKDWINELQKLCHCNGGSSTVDVSEVVRRYAVDVISNTAFGMNVDTIQKPNNEFAKMATRISQTSLVSRLRFAVLYNFPRIRKAFGIPLFDMAPVKYFEQILEQRLRSRLSGEETRNDFLQLLVQAKRGELKVAADELERFEKDAELKGNWDKKQQYLTDVVMKAQCLIFFLAGFSSVTSFITFTLYALALHQDVQKKLREEVGKIVKKDGSLDYDDVGKLVYLDMVTSEVLRKFPGFARLERLCTKEFRDDEIGLVIPKDTTVGIPVTSIHHSKEYYENPDKFDPEHFSPEKKAARSPYAYLPFGAGGRNCIGMRFALIEGKTAIAQAVHNFIIEPTSTTPVPLQGIPLGFGLHPPSNLELKLISITDKKA